MAQHFKINSVEAGKIISLVANTPQIVTAINVLQLNTDQSTFDYNAETGEISILRNSFIEFVGKMHLINTDDETPAVEFFIYLNGAQHMRVYSGLFYHRSLSKCAFAVLAGDVLTLVIQSPETIDLETTTDENFIYLNRLFK